MRVKSLMGVVDIICIVWVGIDGDFLDFFSKVF